jgi:hypothetical protein
MFVFPATTYRPASTLTEAETEEIWQFYSQFTERPREAFVAKLRQAPEVFLCRDRQQVLRAFGSIFVLQTQWQGRPYGLLYTHWTAIDPAWRGKHLVQRIGLRYYLRFRLQHPTTPVYWLVCTSTYKSYLLLARNFEHSWPHRDRPWPAREKALVEQGIAQLGLGQMDPVTGVLHRDGSSRYTDGVVDDPALLADPDIAFYAARNPGHRTGDTLPCLAPLHLRSWVFIGQRLLRGGGRRRGAVTS